MHRRLSKLRVATSRCYGKRTWRLRSWRRRHPNVTISELEPLFGLRACYSFAPGIDRTPSLWFTGHMETTGQARCQARTSSGSTQYDRLVGHECGRPATKTLRPQFDRSGRIVQVCGIHARSYVYRDWEEA